MSIHPVLYHSKLMEMQHPVIVDSFTFYPFYVLSTQFSGWVNTLQVNFIENVNKLKYLRVYSNFSIHLNKISTVNMFPKISTPGPSMIILPQLLVQWKPSFKKYLKTLTKHYWHGLRLVTSEAKQVNIYTCSLLVYHSHTLQRVNQIVQILSPYLLLHSPSAC